MIPRKTGSETSESIASIASRGLRYPESLTLEEIKKVCASALEQRESPTIPILTRRQKRNLLNNNSSLPLPANSQQNKNLPEWMKRLKKLD
jgi:hypothetical protein